MGSLTHKQDDRLGLIDQRRSSIDIDWVRRDLPGARKVAGLRAGLEVLAPKTLWEC